MIRTAALVAIATILTGCASIPGSERIADVVKQFYINDGKPLPPAQDVVIYKDQNVFDAQLHSALVSGLESVNVTLPEGTSAKTYEMPNRLDRWIYAVDLQEDKKVLVCADNAGNESGLDIFKAIVVLAKKASPYVKGYLTYKPTERYNAVLAVDPNDVEKVNRVRFIRSDIEPPACKLGAEGS